MNRVIVTGASGFIGRHAVSALLGRGFEVHALSRGGSLQPAAGHFASHAVDLLDASTTERTIAAIEPSHLLHLAWDVEPGKYWASMNNLAWVAASLSLLRGFHAVGGRRAVFAGTCAEYDWTHSLLCESTTPLRPRGLYGHAKNALHEVVEACSAATGLSIAWGRIFFLYGPGEPQARLVSDAYNALLRGQVMETTHGRQERDFMHVSDVGAAFAALTDSDVAGAVNIASGHCGPLRDILGIIGSLTGRTDLLALGSRAASPDEPARLAADITRLTKELRFVPKFSLQEGLADTLSWWRNRT